MRSRTTSGTSSAPIQRVATFELEALPDGDLFDQRVGNPQVANQVAAQDLNATGGDGAHRELGMTRHTEFADEEHVKRRLQSGRDLVRHRNTSSWKAQHEDVRAAGVLRQLVGQLSSGIGAVTEAHRRSPFTRGMTT